MHGGSDPTAGVSQKNIQKVKKVLWKVGMDVDYNKIWRNPYITAVIRNRLQIKKD